MNIDDCLRILELKQGATLEEIKAARNELLQVWHPDKYASNPKLSEKAKEKTLKINEAFNILVGELKNKEQKYESRSVRKRFSPTAENAVEDDFQKELQRLSKKQEARFKYQERRKNQINHAKRQLNFTLLGAFLAGVFGLFLELKEWAFFIVLVVLGFGLSVSFWTYRKPIRKSRRSSIIR